MTTPAIKWYLRQNRAKRHDPTDGLFQTHRFTTTNTAINTGQVFPERDQAITIGLLYSRTASGALGVLFDFGNNATGMVGYVNDATIGFTAGGVGAAGVTISADILPLDSIEQKLIFAVRPGDGQARIYLNGHVVAAGQSTGGRLLNGHSAAGVNGAIGQPNGTLKTDVPVAARQALANARILGDVDVYNHQLPRNFDVYGLYTGTAPSPGGATGGFDSGFDSGFD